MKFKLDENLGEACAEILRGAGHDVATVFSQSMTSVEDGQLILRCAAEERALVTLDLDFSNPLMFPPQNYAGIAVLRLPPKPSHSTLEIAVRTHVEALKREPLVGQLWSVELGRIRVYQPPRDF